MVYIYHRLFRPRFYDWEAIPSVFRKAIYKLKHKFFPSISITKEPDAPRMLTSFPGPKMKNMLNDLEMSSQDYLNTQIFVNHSKSFGNYFVDCDDNVYLDLTTNIGSLPLGHNHPELLKLTKDDNYIRSVLNKLDSNNYYSTDMQRIVDHTISHITPKQLHKLIPTCGCGSSANELAIKLAMFRRGNFSKEQNLRSLDMNTQWSVLSFKHGFHGRISGSLSLTRSKPIHKLGIAQYDWPSAPFPMLKFPLKENAEYNAQEEKRCLEETEKIMQSHPNIAALVVEPAQAEGGDFWGSPNFFKQLRELTLKYKIDFICDEVQTGMATGRYWAHELWDLPTPPDMVTFAKKFQISGVFVRKEIIPKNLTTELCGEACFDQFRLHNLAKIVEVIEKGKLFEKAEKTSDKFKNKFRELVSTLDRPIYFNIRGKGNFLAFDLPDSKTRDLFIKYSKNRGVSISGCGENSIRLRPSLLIEDKHYDIFLDVVKGFTKLKLI